MKKIILMTACMLYVSSMAFAANSITMALTSKNTTGGSVHADSGTASANTALIGKNSTGVGTGLLSNVNGYSIVTQHMSGSKAYASSYDSTSLFSEDVTTVGTPLLTKPTATDTSSFSSWDQL
jgi:hypothetical protein